MTAAEWEALDKKPGMVLYLSRAARWESKSCDAGRLVSYIGYGATLDFTVAEYNRVERGYYPYQMLYETEESLWEARQKEKEEKERRAREARERERQAQEKRAKARVEREKAGNGKGARQRKAVKCIETGVTYSSLSEAGDILGLTAEAVSYSLKRGAAYKGEFHFVDA